MNNFEAAITKWITEKGFGFIEHEGKRIFVHRKSFDPQVQAGTDIAGRKIWVKETEMGEKGLLVKKAITLETKAQQELEEQKREIAKKERVDELRLKQQAEVTRFQNNPHEIFQLIGAKMPVYGGSGPLGGGIELLYAASATGEEPWAEMISASEAGGPVYKLTQKVQVGVNGMGFVPAIDLGVHEVCCTVAGWEAIKNVFPEPVGKPNDSGLLKLRWGFQVKHTKTPMSFELDMPVIVLAPEIQQKGWCKQPTRVTQRLEVRQGGAILWAKAYELYPNAEIEVQGGFQDEAHALIEKVKIWTGVPQLHELIAGFEFEFEFGILPFDYFRYESEWNGRDGEESCDFKQVAVHWTEAHPGIQTSYKNAPLLAGKTEYEKNYPLGTKWKNKVRVDDEFTLESIRQKFNKWVSEAVKSFDFPDTEHVRLFVQNLVQKMMDRMPLTKTESPYLVSDAYPGLGQVRNRIMKDDNVAYVVFQEQIEKHGEYEKLEGEWLAWQEIIPEPVYKEPVLTLLNQEWDEIQDIFEDDGRYDFLTWRERDELRSFVEETRRLKFESLDEAAQEELLEKIKNLIEKYDSLMDALDPLIEKHNAGDIYLQLEIYQEGGKSGGWVILPDGSVRGEDGNNCSRHKHQGLYWWKVVGEKGELAVWWEKESKWDEQPKISSFIPKAGITDQQRQKIAELEKTFGFQIASKL